MISDAGTKKKCRFICRCWVVGLSMEMAGVATRYRVVVVKVVDIAFTAGFISREVN